ncbi:MAG: aldo/keto reductase [Pseudomonadota bacterium]
MNAVREIRTTLANSATPNLGFGTGHLGSKVNRQQSVELLRAAFEAGIRYFDTARLYGQGSAEHFIAEALGRSRQDIILASKAGIIPWRSLTAQRVAGKLNKLLLRKSPAIDNKYNAFSIKELTSSLHTSLKALQTDYLDILLLHECTLEDAQRDDLRAWAEGLKKSGKIRCFGTAAVGSDSNDILAAPPNHINIMQCPDSLNTPADLPSQMVNDPSWFFVTHSHLAQVLPSHTESNQLSDNIRSFLEEYGVTDVRIQDLAALLIKLGCARNPNGVVLFSASSTERLRSTIRDVCDNKHSNSQILEIAEGLRRLTA